MSEKIRILYYALWVAHPVFQTVIAIASIAPSSFSSLIS
jgi:hypothetical protein